MPGMRALQSGRGVRLTRASSNSTVPRSHRSAKDESRPEKFFISVPPFLCGCFSEPQRHTEHRADYGSPPSCLLVVHLFPDVTIVVHVHEKVLAPFGSRVRVVAKHDALELHA